MKINIKKIMGLVLGTTILASSIGFAAPQPIQAFNQQDFTIKINGLTQVHPEGLKPIVYNNRTYLPAAFIAELLGAKVSFISDTKTVSIDEDRSELAKANETIKAYEEEIEELKLELEKIKNTSKPDDGKYSKFPQRISRNGFSIALEGLSVNQSNDGRLFFTLKNDDFESSVKLVPMETVIEIEGVKYTSQPTATDPLNQELFQWVKTGDSFSGVIPFRKLPDDKDIKNIKVTLYYETNERMPAKSSYEFYLIND